MQSAGPSHRGEPPADGSPRSAAHVAVGRSPSGPRRVDSPGIVPMVSPAFASHPWETPMRLTALYLTSITCGFCMMALEILGGRFIQPVFGSSIDVWAAIISGFILSLSIGYVAGGRVADRSHSNGPLGWVIVLAGVFFLLTPVYGMPLMLGL